MSYILGTTTLLNPKSFKREFMETAGENLLATGKSTKRVENRKERFFLRFQNLTQAQVNALLAEYELEAVRDFSVTETNLTIAATEVLVDIKAREYPPTGPEYREDITLILTEVL